MMLIVIFLFSFCCLEAVSTVSIRYCITKDHVYNKSVCNGYQSCHTLNQLAINTSLLFNEHANYSLILEGGTHQLTSELIVSAINLIDLFSFYDSALINITHGNLTIYGVSSFSMSHVKLFCAQNILSKPSFKLLQIKIVKLRFVFITGLTMDVVYTETSTKVDSVFALYNSRLERVSFNFKLKNCVLLVLYSYLDKSTFVGDSTLTVTTDPSGNMMKFAGCEIFGLVFFIS